MIKEESGKEITFKILKIAIPASISTTFTMLKELVVIRIIG